MFTSLCGKKLPEIVMCQVTMKCLRALSIEQKVNAFSSNNVQYSILLGHDTQSQNILHTELPCNTVVADGFSATVFLCWYELVYNSAVLNGVGFNSVILCLIRRMTVTPWIVHVFAVPSRFFQFPILKLIR